MKRLSLKLILAGLLLQTIVVPAWAVSYDLKDYTPEVKAALAGRQGRYQQLTAAKTQGAVGENKDGLVEQRGGGSDAASLVNAENQDRMVIYRAIVQQNNLPENSLITVQQVFADVQRNKASPGDPIQLPSGEWTKK